MKATALLLIAFLVGCRPTTTQGAYPSAYEAALLDRDGDLATALLKSAASSGDTGAFRTVADAAATGFLVSPRVGSYLYTGGLAAEPDSQLTFRLLPGEGALIAYRYRRSLDKAAASGEPDALLAVAETLLGAQARVASGQLRSLDPLAPAELDSARHIYDRLTGADVPRVRLAWIARGLGDEGAFARHIAEGIEADEPLACQFHVWHTGVPPDLSSTQGYADFYDRVLGCDPDEGYAYVADSIAYLAGESERGNEAAAVAVDSLRQLGVFERHPQLAALVSP